MRTGVYLPNWIGDVVMATPALRALRKLTDQQPSGGQLVGVMKPYVREVVAGLGWFDDVVPLDRSHGVAQLRAARLDRLLLLTNSFRTAWLAWRAGVRERIGYGTDARRLLLTRPIKPIGGGGKQETPPIDGYRRLAYALGAEPEPPVLEVATTAEDEQAADGVWRRFGLPTDGVVVLNSGGAFGDSKSWPAEHFAQLAKRLTEQTPLHVLVNCGPAERDTARRIAAGSRSDRVHSLADWPTRDAFRVPIGLSKAVIRRSRLLVTTDSGPRFFGIAFGKPVVSLFGPTGFHATRTYYQRETPLSLDLDCRPCMKRECPLKHHRCMRELTVDRVLAAALQQLAAPADRRRAG